MGFLKFLKRDKTKEQDFGLEGIDDLDIPPLPPNAKEAELTKIPELPEMPGNLPEAKDFRLQPLEEEFPKLEVTQELNKEFKLPPMEDFTKLPKSVVPQQHPPLSRPLFGMYPNQQFAKLSPYQKLEEKAIKEERSILSHKQSKGPIFVRAERFKWIVANTSTVRGNLKIAEESIGKLIGIDQRRDRVFEKWHKVMADIQKKFIFIDKTLFKR